MSIEETTCKARLMTKEVRELAQAKNAKETTARLKAVDERVCHILQRNTLLTQEVDRLKQLESRSKAIHTSDKKQIELLKVENQKLQRELSSFRASAALKEHLRLTRSCDPKTVQNTSLKAQEIAIETLKRELDTTKSQLAEARMGLPLSPLRFPASGSALRVPPSSPNSPIDVPLNYFSSSPAITRPLIKKQSFLRTAR
jgi:hypothetical protein